MKNGACGGVIKLGNIAALIPGPAGERAATALKRGTLDVALSIPVPPNVQTPHEQDELYVVVSGSGILVHDHHRDPFEAGDLLFVPAGVEHHYTEFGNDLVLWRIFYGRSGGELTGG